MTLFRQRGYDATQITDIVARLGIAPPSFYAAFRSKEAAFIESVDLYVATVGVKLIDAMNEADEITAAIRALLHQSIAVALECASSGCLLAMGASMGPFSSQSAEEHVRAARLHTLSLIMLRIERAMHDGQLPNDTAAQALARFYLGVMQAISFQARDGATRAELLNMVEPAIDAVVMARRGRP